MTQAARLVLLAVLAALPVASAGRTPLHRPSTPPVKNSTSPPVWCATRPARPMRLLGDRQVWAPYAAGAPTRCWPRCSRAGRHAAARRSSADEATLRAAVEYMLSSAR